MKLTSLGSATQAPAYESKARQPAAGGERVRRVEALESLDSDRQRSLQQEIAEIEAEAIGNFAGGDKILQDARAVAARLAALGAAADELLKPSPMSNALPTVDDSA